MVRFLLNHFPTWSVILGMMLACCAVGWIIYLLVNRYGAEFLVSKDPHYARESMHLASTLSAFILAFMIVLLWQSYTKLEDTVLEEAKSIGRLEVFSESLPHANDIEISIILEEYVQVLINDEWKSMVIGQSSPKATELLNALRLAIEKIPSDTSTLSNYRQQMLDDFNDISFDRHMRLEHLHSTIPTFFMVTIFANMIGMFILLCLLKPVVNIKSHHFYLLVVSMLVGLNLSFLLILDYPFSGELSISSDPLKHIHF